MPENIIIGVIHVLLAVDRAGAVHHDGAVTEQSADDEQKRNVDSAAHHGDRFFRLAFRQRLGKENVTLPVFHFQLPAEFSHTSAERKPVPLVGVSGFLRGVSGQIGGIFG